MFHVEQMQEKYIEFLFEYNKSVNLVSRRMEEKDIQILIKESFLLKKYLLNKEVVADVGSGNGLLGVPLAWEMDNDVYLVEPLKKKTDFLRKYKDKYDVKNLEVFTMKVEIFIENNKTDVIIARGFPYNRIFAEYLIKRYIDKVVLITSKNKYSELIKEFNGKIDFTVEDIPWRDNLIILKMENVSRGTK